MLCYKNQFDMSPIMYGITWTGKELGSPRLVPVSLVLVVINRELKGLDTFQRWWSTYIPMQFDVLQTKACKTSPFVVMHTPAYELCVLLVCLPQQIQLFHHQFKLALASSRPRGFCCWLQGG